MFQPALNPAAIPLPASVATALKALNQNAPDMEGRAFSPVVFSEPPAPPATSSETLLEIRDAEGRTHWYALPENVVTEEEIQVRNPDGTLTTAKVVNFSANTGTHIYILYAKMCAFITFRGNRGSPVEN